MSVRCLRSAAGGGVTSNVPEPKVSEIANGVSKLKISKIAVNFRRPFDLLKNKFKSLFYKNMLQCSINIDRMQLLAKLFVKC